MGTSYNLLEEVSSKPILVYLYNLCVLCEKRSFIPPLIMYLCIKNDKILVEEDATNLCLVDDLLSAGISQSDIVLGFHHPHKRNLTEFATA
jgi:XisI protein